MKNFLKLGFLGLVSLFMITSCEEDPLSGPGGPGTGGDDAPELIFGTGADLLSFDATVAPGEIFTVQLQAAKGTADLSSLTIIEDGVRLQDFSSRVSINGEPASSAAISLFGDDKTSFIWNVSIKAKEDRSVTLYEFILEDEGGLTAATDIQISTELTGTEANPEISLIGNTNVITDPGGKVCFRLDVTAANADLSSLIVVDEQGVTIDPSRVFYGGSDASNQVPENPYLLPLEDVRGFDKSICIQAQADESEQAYTIAISDTRDSFDLVQVVINTFPSGISGEDVTELTGRLLNRAGPAGTGGLDLDNGEGTGSSDTAAELKDNGIDAGPIASNWLQRISGANGTTLKQLIPNMNGLSENFTYESVTKDTGISGIWGNGVDLQGVNSVGEAWTDVVEVGDLFIAERGGKYYLLQITEVSIDQVANNDFYRMNIKF